MALRTSIVGVGWERALPCLSAYHHVNGGLRDAEFCRQSLLGVEATWRLTAGSMRRVVASSNLDDLFVRQLCRWIRRTAERVLCGAFLESRVLARRVLTGQSPSIWRARRYLTFASLASALIGRRQRVIDGYALVPRILLNAMSGQDDGVQVPQAKRDGLGLDQHVRRDGCQETALFVRATQSPRPTDLVVRRPIAPGDVDISAELPTQQFQHAASGIRQQNGEPEANEWNRRIAFATTAHRVDERDAALSIKQTGDVRNRQWVSRHA